MNSLEGRLKANQMRDRVLRVLEVWDDWCLFPLPFLQELKTNFLGKVNIDGHNHPQLGSPCPPRQGWPLPGPCLAPALPGPARPVSGLYKASMPLTICVSPIYAHAMHV